MGGVFQCDFTIERGGIDPRRWFLSWALPIRSASGSDRAGTECVVDDFGNLVAVYA